MAKNPPPRKPTGTKVPSPPQQRQTRPAAPSQADGAKAPKKRRKKRRVSRFAIAVTVFVSIVVICSALTLLLLFQPGKGGTAAERPAVFGVHQIEVVGETRYAKEDIIAASGIEIGQSILTVKKVQAHDNIMAKFPYLERVDVSNSSFDTVKIEVWEVDPIGVMQTGDAWFVVGSNNKAVESLPASEEPPAAYLCFKGATTADGAVGGKAMDDRSFGIVTTMLQAIADSQLENIRAIDMRNKSNICLEWNGQLTVMLGTENDLEKKVAAFANFLPDLLSNNGGTVSGRFDLRNYMEDSKAIYTPADILASQTAAGTTTSAPTAAG